MKIQTREYIEFINTFVEKSNIMTKSFLSSFRILRRRSVQRSKNPLANLSARKRMQATTVRRIANAEFDEYRSQLEQRVRVVEQGLVRCGIRVAELGTEEVVELYYKIFNPGETEKPIQIN
jgi:hypothetical protein